MLAYLFWHRPAPAVEPAAYELRARAASTARSRTVLRAAFAGRPRCARPSCRGSRRPARERPRTRVMRTGTSSRTGPRWGCWRGRPSRAGTSVAHEKIASLAGEACAAPSTGCSRATPTSRTRCCRFGSTPVGGRRDEYVGGAARRRHGPPHRRAVASEPRSGTGARAVPARARGGRGRRAVASAQGLDGHEPRARGALAWLGREPRSPPGLRGSRRVGFATLAFVVATGARVELTTGKRRREHAARLGTSPH